MRHINGDYLDIGDLIYYGKFKNALARITGFGKNEKGDPTVTAQPVNKDGSPKKSKPKEMVLLKVRKYEPPKKEADDMNAARRVVARYLEARGLDLGKSWENAKVRIHRYSNIFKIWDLANAGKRGKKVRVMTVGPNTHSRSEEEAWMQEQSKYVLLNASGGYDSIKRYFEGIEGASIDERAERGVDVRPGEMPEFKLQWKADGDELHLTATPQEFLLSSSVPLSHPKTGKPIGRQDTLYYSRGKRDAAIFYRWLLDDGPMQIQRMRISEIRKLWNQLKVKYDYH